MCVYDLISPRFWGVCLNDIAVPTLHCPPPPQIKDLISEYRRIGGGSGHSHRNWGEGGPRPQSQTFPLIQGSALSPAPMTNLQGEAQSLVSESGGSVSSPFPYNSPLIQQEKSDRCSPCMYTESQLSAQLLAAPSKYFWTDHHLPSPSPHTHSFIRGRGGVLPHILVCYKSFFPRQLLLLGWASSNSGCQAGLGH